jgi:hypothetical protein
LPIANNYADLRISITNATSSIRHVSEWPQRQSDLICAPELVIVNVPLAAPIGLRVAATESP